MSKTAKEAANVVNALTPQIAEFKNTYITYYDRGIADKPRRLLVAQGSVESLKEIKKFRDNKDQGWVYAVPGDLLTDEIRAVLIYNPTYEKANRNPEGSTFHMMVKNTSVLVWIPRIVTEKSHLLPNHVHFFVRDPKELEALPSLEDALGCNTSFVATQAEEYVLA